jgi:hypothetical protein
VPSHIFTEARADAAITAAILGWLRANPGRDYSARHIWGALPDRYPLRAVAACLDTLYRNGHLTRRKTGRARLYATVNAPAQRPTR